MIGSPPLEEHIFENALQKDIDKVLTGLNSRETEVICLYFGLGHESPLPLDQIGIRFKLTREQLRQIKEVALSKLRHPRLHTRVRSNTESVTGTGAGYIDCSIRRVISVSHDVLEGVSGAAARPGKILPPRQ